MNIGEFTSIHKYLTINTLFSNEIEEIPISKIETETYRITDQYWTRNILFPHYTYILFGIDITEKEKCIYDANSPYLKCAVNPTGNCNSCKHFLSE